MVKSLRLAMEHPGVHAPSKACAALEAGDALTLTVRN